MSGPADLARSIGEQADRTPADRNRVVDAVRAGSICVVVVWHWTLSINHRDEQGRLVNPNPIAEVPLGWTATWALQVMPLFFIVGGFANHAAWCSTVDDDGATREFWRRRARRLLAPVVAFLMVWLLYELIAPWLVSGHRSLVNEAPIVVTPLWFVGAYAWVVALVPITARLHHRWPGRSTLILILVVALADLARFGLGWDQARWINTAMVWILIHQLGYWWADGTLTTWSTSRRLGMFVAGLAGLTVLTWLPAYPRSMVATTDTDISHMYPPTAALVVLAVSQLGLILSAEDRLQHGLERRRAWTIIAWTTIVGVNAVILTIYVWHMTALLIMIWIFEALGGELGAEPTLSWWLARPLWLVGPVIVLVPFLAVFGRIEAGRSRSENDRSN